MPLEETGPVTENLAENLLASHSGNHPAEAPSDAGHLSPVDTRLRALKKDEKRRRLKNILAQELFLIAIVLSLVADISCSRPILICNHTATHHNKASDYIYHSLPVGFMTIYMYLRFEVYQSTCLLKFMREQSDLALATLRISPNVGRNVFIQKIQKELKQSPNELRLLTIALGLSLVLYFTFSNSAESGIDCAFNRNVMILMQSITAQLINKVASRFHRDCIVDSNNATQEEAAYYDLESPLAATIAVSNTDSTDGGGEVESDSSNNADEMNVQSLPIARCTPFTVASQISHAEGSRGNRQHTQVATVAYIDAMSGSMGRVM